MSTDLQFAALLCSKICHDLISPVSALNNGIEVLNDDDDPEMREHALSLIEMSGKQASIKLQFARLAFGASTLAGDMIHLDEVREITEALIGGKKIKVLFEGADRAVEKAAAKILMNLAIISADTIPRGGTLLFDCSPKKNGPGEKTIFRVRSDGDRARFSDEIKQALYGEASLQNLDARSIQPFLTSILIKSTGYHLRHTLDPDKSVEFRILEST